MRLVPPTFELYSGDPEQLVAGSVGLIVTPNLDHLRLLKLSRSFRRAYAQADVVLNDSRFLDKLAIRGRALCLPGSELAPQRLSAPGPAGRVAVIGGDADVRSFLTKAYPAARFHFIAPSMGYVARRAERRGLVQALLAEAVDLVFICTGAPQSELFAAQLKRAGCTADMLCCGSAFNFLSGTKRRAPKAFQTAGAEWLWRFLSEPHTRRRYIADALFLLRRAPAFFSLRRTGAADFGTYRLRVKPPKA